MTNSNYTAIQLLLDRSGSMQKIKDDVEGGVKTFIEDQRKASGKCTLRICQFDTLYEEVCPSTSIADAIFPGLDPRGGTALLDAWGRAVVEFGEELSNLPEDARPGNVIFVVVTDGEENSSREWTRAQVFDKVTEQQTRYNWQFLYLAANQDAVAEGAKYGVPGAQAVTYDWDAGGTKAAYSALSNSVLRTRGGGEGAFTDAERRSAQRKP